MPNTIQIIDDLALVPLTSSEVASLTLMSLGVITIQSGGSGSGDMNKAVFATLNPGAGFVDKAITAQSVPYSGLTSLPGGTTNFLRADGTFALPPGQIYNVAAIGTPGLAPALPPSSGTNYFLRGDASWQLLSSFSVAYTQLTGVPTTFSPSSHASTHITGGTDVIPVVTTTQTGLVPIRPTASQNTQFHRADNVWAPIPNVSSGAAGMIPQYPNNTTTFFRGDGTYAVPSYTALASLPTSFTPSQHASTHITGGSDVIPNFSIGGTASGLAPASPGGTTTFLRADGTWFAPTGSGGLASASGAGLLSTLPALPASNQALYYAGGDNLFHLISSLSIAYTQLTGVPIFSGGSAGLVPNSLGGTLNFLRADGVYSQPAGALVTTTSFGAVSQLLSAGSQASSFLRGDNTWQPISSLSSSILYSSLSGLPTTFAPSNHSTRHITAGQDLIPLPTVSLPGLVPVLPSVNSNLNFLRGDATFAQIPVASAGQAGLVPAPTNLTTQWLRGDATFQAIPGVSTAAAGLAPAFPGNTSTFFRGDGTYTSVDYTNAVSGKPTTFPATAHATTHISTGTDIIPLFSLTSATTGLVPGSTNGDVTKFLRADATWQTPAGAGDVSHTRQILTVNSLTGGGDLSADRTLSLVGDVASPGAFSLYSTNTGGTRGWNAFTSFPAATNLVKGLVNPSNNATQFLSGVATFVVPPTFTSTTPGYVPASGGSASNFLSADGTWKATPAASLATTSSGGIVPSLPSAPNQTLSFLRGDDTWQLLSGLTFAYSQISGVPVFSGTSTPGLVPGSTGLASTFLRGDATFAVPPLAQTGNPGYISGLPASQGTQFWARGDNSWQLLPDTVLVVSPWTMPLVGNQIAGVTVTSTTNVEAGMTVYTQGSATFNTMMDIVSVDGPTTMTLINRGYAPSPSAGTSIPGGLMFIIGPGQATSGKSGFVPTPTGNPNQFLAGDGTWLTPSAGSGSGTVNTQFSITGDGSLGSKLQLVNDTNLPGNFQFYSTDSSGNRGWFPLTFSWETNATFVMPGIGATQNITLFSNVGITTGMMLVFVDNAIPAHQAFLEVVSVNGDLVHIVVINRGFTFNTAPAVTFATSAVVTLAGPSVMSSTSPGWTPTPSGTTTKFLRDDGTFSVPSTVTTANPGYVPTAPNDVTKFLNGLGAFSIPTITTLASTGTQGAVTGLPASNQATSFLRGDNTWQLFSTLSSSILYSSLSGLPSSFTPSTHASSHISTGSDVIPLFSTASTTSGLVPGSSTGGTSNYLRADGTWATPPSAGLATTGVAGLAAGLPASAQTTYYLRGDDSWQLISSLSIAYSQLTSVPSTFAPTTHASSHLDNGSDTIPVVAGLRTGLVPVLPSSAPTTKFLRGDATWTVIPTVQNGVDGLAPGFPGTTTTFLRGDGTYAAVPSATATVSGLVPTPPNNQLTYLRGDATFAVLPMTWNITTSFTQPAIAGNITGVVFTTTTGLVAGMSIATIDSSNKTNYYTVSSITDGTHAVLINNGAFGNTASASTVNAGKVNLISPPVMTATGGGIVPTPPNDSTKFLSGSGSWLTPASSGVTAGRLVATQFSLTGGGDLSADRTLNLVNDTASPGTFFLYGTDGSGVRGWQASTSLPVATVSNAGLVPTLSGTTNTFLRGDGTFAAPSSLANASTGVAGIVVGLPASNQTSQWLRADNSWAFLPDSNVTTASWTMPAVGSTVSAVTFNSTSNWDVGMTLFFATGSGSTCCFMEVNTVTDSTHLVLINRGYVSNPAPTTVIPACMAFVVGPGIATNGTAGLLPKTTGSVNSFLRADATYAVPPTVTTSNPGYAPATGGSVATNFLCADLTWKVPPGTLVTTSNSGTVTQLPSSNATAQFLRGDNSWAIPTGTSSVVNTNFTWPAANGTVAVNVASSAEMMVGSALYFPLFGTAEVTVVTDSTHVTIRNNSNSGNLTSGTVTSGTTVYIGTAGAKATATASGVVPTPPNNTTTYLRGDATFAAVPAATSTVSGLVPTPPNNTDQWLRGDATWVQAPPLAQTTTATFTWPAVGGTSASIAVDSSSNMKVGMAIYVPALGVAEVMTLPDSTHMTIRNNGNTGNAGSTAGVAIGTSIYVGGAGSLATATSTGMIPVPPNNTTTFLRGDATFAAPANATATTAGYVPTPPNNTTTFLRGDATFATPPAATATTTGYVPTPPNNTTTFLRGDATFTTLPANSTSSLGTVASSPNDTLKFYRGDSTWDFSPNTTETNGTFTVPAIGSTVAVTVVSAAWTAVGQTVWISDGTNKGFFEITVRSSATSITVKNVGYLGNSTSGTMATASIVQLQAPSVATATQPGFVPVPPNNTTTYLRGDATFAAVPAATATVSGLVPTPPNNTTTFLRGDATFTTLPANSTSSLGTVAASPNDTLKYYRGDSTWDFAPNTTETNGTFTVPAIGSTVAVTVVSATWTIVGQTVWISDGTNKGFFEITVRTSNTSITVKNVGYLGNSTSGTMATASIVQMVSPSVATATQPGFVPVPPNNTTTFLRGDATFAAPATMTATVGGLVPTPPNNTTTFLRGDATFAAVTGGTKTYSVFKALDANPPASNYGVFGTRNSIPFVAFNDTTSWSTFFVGVIPESASLGSGLVVRIHWMAATATSGNVMWRIYFERMNTDLDSDSFDTVTSAAAAAANGTSGILTVTATTCTTIDSVTAGDGYRLKIDRDAANVSDTMTGDAQIVLVEVRAP